MKQFSQFLWYFLTGSNILSTVFSDILDAWASYPHRVRRFTLIQSAIKDRLYIVQSLRVETRDGKKDSELLCVKQFLNVLGL